MTENTIIEPTPVYWDGESALFMQDANTGNVHTLEPEGFDLDEWFEEQKEAVRIRKGNNA